MLTENQTLCAYPNRGERVTEIVVRNAREERQALTVLAGPQANLVTNIRYVGWPVSRLDSEMPLDLVHCSSRIEEMRERAERQYCLIRYGKEDRRLMTGSDKAAVKLNARFANDNRTLLVDLSQAMNANIAAARVRAVELAVKPAQDMFGLRADNDVTAEKGGSEYGKWHAAADVGKTAVHRLSPRGILATVLGAAVVAGIAWTCVKFHDANLNHQLESKKEDNAQQLKIAELNQRVITSQNGRPVALSSAANATLDHEDVEELRHVAMMNQMELEHPLVRFVSAQSLDGVASVMEAAPETGKVWVNSAEMQAAVARAAAKSLRKSAQVRRAGGGWITEIIPTKSSGA